MGKVFIKDKVFYQSLFTVTLPIVAMNVITIGVNMMDTIMLGSFGEVQLSGSSLANDFINIFQILCMGMGCGAAVLTAQFWGSRNIRDLKRTVTIMLWVAVVIAFLFTLAALFVPELIMSIYTKDKSVIESGALYFRWSVPTFLLMGLSLTLTHVLRSVKSVKIPLAASVVSFFVNIFFNWVFIFGHLGAPRMEIAGAALGTVIARVAECTIICIFFFFKDESIGYRLEDMKSRVNDLVSVYFRFSLPVLASDSLLGFGNTAVSIVIGHMGTTYTAAYAIIAMIQRLSTVFTGALGQASHTVVGNMLGAGEKEKAQTASLTLLVISSLIGICAMAFIFFSGEWIISFYNITVETHRVALLMNDAMAIMVFFQSLQSVITKGVLRGGGDTLYALCIDAVFLWILSVPLGILTGLVWHMNAFIVLVSLKIDWAVKTVLGICRILSGKWRKEIKTA